MSTLPALAKAIQYDAETRDFAMYLDKEIVGYARSYADAELRLNELVHDILTHRQAGEDVGDDDNPANDELAALAGERSYQPTPEELGEVSAWLEDLDAAGWFTLPPAGLVREALVRLQGIAEAAGDARNARALGRALAMVDSGAYGRVTVDDDGAVVVPSQRPGEAPYRVDDRGCACPAGTHG